MDIEQQVMSILAEHATLDVTAGQKTLPLSEFGLDSLGLVEIIFALEEAFDITIPFNADAALQTNSGLDSVGSLISLVQGLVAKKAA